MMSRYPNETVERFDQQFSETMAKRNERLAAKRRKGNSKMVYDKATRTIVIKRGKPYSNHRVSAGPYTLEIPPNGVAVLYEGDSRLPGGVGYLGALVQFAGEVIHLRAILDTHTQQNDVAAAIRLSLAEIQSGLDRVRFAEGLIRQLPQTHDGRNTWLLNYGISDEAAAKREEREIAWVAETKCAEQAK